MIDGLLIENVNKRSEASNRKYRAFIHFMKYAETHPTDKKITSTKLVDAKLKNMDKENMKSDIKTSG